MLFISYRREDTKAEVTHLHRRLAERYGDENVFVDYHDIPAGEEWPAYLQAQLEKRQLVLAVIGAKWGDARFGVGRSQGRLRLDDKNDWVRQEICTALRIGKRLIVILIDGAKLPETGWDCELDTLPKLQHQPIRNQKDFERDLEDLFRQIEVGVADLKAAAEKRLKVGSPATEFVATATRPRVDVLDRIRSTQRLRVGYIHYPPFALIPSTPEEPTSGLYVDLIRRMCEAEGITAEFEQVRFSSALSRIQKDSVDAILSIFQTPRRSRVVDFCAFLHTVSVSGVTRFQEDRISSQADLQPLPLKFVVCQGEIGHEILEDHLKIPESRMTIINTSNIADIIEMVASNRADVAIADSLSCQHGLNARGAEGPKLKPILRRRPLYLCQNGVMIAQQQEALAAWFDKGLREMIRQPEFVKAEKRILKDFRGIISKM